MSDQTTVANYQAAFHTPAGREVFIDILGQLGFFSAAIETDADRIRLNEAHAFLANCGIWHPNNARAIADALLALPGHHQEPVTNEGDE